MTRWPVRLLLASVALAACAGLLEAGQKQARIKREKLQYPPRYVRVSNVQNYVFRDKNGNVHVRKVPSGYAEQFPTPALFYYGYPHSGDDTGLGF
jgi:hypothetical protein